jgi:hypothetical protein
MLREEFDMVMRLMGVTRVADIAPAHVATDSVRSHTTIPKDFLFQDAYVPLKSNL